MLDTTTAYGLTYLFPIGDSAVGHSLRTYGEFARAEVDLIDHYVSRAGPGGTFIDVGANIGAICLPVAARHRDVGEIALEAQRRIHGLLCANSLNNRLMNVECHHLAAGSRNGTARFPSLLLSTKGNFGDVGTEVKRDDQTLESVQMRRLDDLGTERVAFIKIDVQGAELDVLRGATELIRRDQPAMLLEVTRSKEDDTRAVSEFMLQLGYHLFVFFSPFASPNCEKWIEANPTLRGDFSFLALPAAEMNDWSLGRFVSVEHDWPGHVREFQYLKRYGH